MQPSDLGGLWLLALAAPLVLLYILKTRRSRQRVPSIWLWQSSARDLKARHPWRKLRLVLPLLLQLATLLLLALAATRPFGAGGDPALEHGAIVLDTSASMQARDASGVTRMELAKAAAREHVLSHPNAEMLLIASGSNVSVLSPFERDRQRLLRHIDAVTAEDTEGQLTGAVALAAARLRRTTGKQRLLVITDGALAERGALTAQDVDVDVLKVGTPVENTALVHLDVRAEKPSSEQRSGDLDSFPVQVFARVHNFGARPRNLFVTLRQQNVDQPLASRRLQLSADEDAPVVLTFDATPADRGSGLIVELSPNDELPVDDRAYAVVPHGRRQRVVLYPKDSTPWLERALLADPEVELLTAPNEVSMLDSGARGALLVYVGICPGTLPAGTFVVLNPPEGPCLGARVGPEVEFPKVTSWRESDSRLRFLSLSNLRVQRARPIQVNSETDALVRTQSGVLIANVELQGRTGTLVAFDFADSDWPLQSSFVLFARNLVELAREQRLGTQDKTLRTGQPMPLPVPLDTTRVELVAPEIDTPQVLNAPTNLSAPANLNAPLGLKVQTLEAQRGLTALPALLRAGFYHASWNGRTPSSTLLVANLLSERESDLRERPLPKAQLEGVSTPLHEAKSVADWSWLLALLALVLLLVEVAYFTRNQQRPSRKLASHIGESRA